MNISNMSSILEIDEAMRLLTKLHADQLREIS